MSYQSSDIKQAAFNSIRSKFIKKYQLLPNFFSFGRIACTIAAVITHTS